MPYTRRQQEKKGFRKDKSVLHDRTLVTSSYNEYNIGLQYCFVEINFLCFGKGQTFKNYPGQLLIHN